MLGIAEHDLGVRSYVDEKLELIGTIRSFRDDRASGVGADVASDAGEHVDLCGVASGDVEFPRRNGDRSIGR